MAIKLFDLSVELEICKLYSNNMTTIEIAKKYNCDPETIRKCLKGHNIIRRETGDVLRAKLNERFFESIDNEIKAYWLGYLAADACIGLSAGTRRSIRFYVAAKDKWAIEQFAKDIDYSGKLRTVLPPRNQMGICFNSPTMANDLIKLGYLDWKLGNPQMLSNVPGGLIHHFIRGFFDGDGSIVITYNRISPSYSIIFTAHKNDNILLGKIEDMICSILPINQNGVKIRQTCCVIRWGGNIQVKSIVNWLYAGATRFLERKRDKILPLLKPYDFEFDKIIIKNILEDHYVQFLDKFHYMGAGGRRGSCFGAYVDNKLIAIALFGSITRRETADRLGLNSSQISELARFCIHPYYGKKGLGSWFLSRATKTFFSMNPNITTLISFADSTQGHIGTLYKASNWVYDGKTGKSYHYENNSGQKFHKKTIYGLAVKNSMSEKEYTTENNLIKVRHKSKFRFLYHR